MDTQHKYWKVPEVARLLRIPRTRAYDLVARGHMPGVVRIGRSIRVNRKELEAWLSDQQYRRSGSSG